ncbi:hypothetical protein H1230_16325 [Paenibacillus sp. 19GGS1-52]|uniref:hypothetical protein n=1 Tax=Paenibacillus sp. 19GGS1-52 TaxID=2758563 RepID=UPI001EFB86BB|nr:hypothetical protein [Paenibacillus sp. 19GGS1-52]ULO04734.1 hypothetical protein H1230_16325 [Paenibacillus sp. 19GGS1-52]
MIKVMRPIEIPATLVSECAPGGRLEYAIKVYSDYFTSLSVDGEDKSEKIYKFLNYDEPDVRQKLTELFHRKCAYCESFYAGTGLLEIEHFRPKAEVKQARDVPKQRTGYYWLAWEWKNLLPSCHNRNCVINQYVVGGDTPEVKVLRGKGNLFPLLDNKMRVSHHENSDSLANEIPLILNPCEDDPRKYLEFSDEGHIYPKENEGGPDCEKGYWSIVTYGLDRKDLFIHRNYIANLIKKQIGRVRRCLTKWMIDSNNKCLEEELIQERDDLYDFMKPEREFSLMASQIIHRFCVDAGLDCPCCITSTIE